MSNIFKRRANRDRAPQATRPKTTHTKHSPSRARGYYCSFCGNIAVHEHVDTGKGFEGALCGRRECRKKMEAL